MILIAGVGYSHLSDLSFGPLLIEHLQEGKARDDIEIQDLSYGPIAVVQWFQDRPDYFDRAIMIGAMEHGRPPGMLKIYDWQTGQHSPEEVQERVAEAVTGVTSIDNMLVIAEYFEVLPPQTTVIELEPLVLEWGLELSPFGTVRMNETLEWIEQEVGPLTGVTT